MKLIHTADVHLDRCFSGMGDAATFGNRRRQSLRDAFHGIVTRAREWPADALLIAGDLFEHDRVNRDTVAFLISEFKSIPDVRVFIAPGNHDPYVSDSPYAVEKWPENVTIFSSPEWTSHSVLDGALTVHGFAFDGPVILLSPFGSLQVPEGAREGVHVAVAHGSERDHQPPDKDEYAPFHASEAAVDGLSYLALGHFHSMTQIKGDFDTTMYYSGSPEGHGFRDVGPRHYLEIEIEEGKAKVTPVVSSRTEYLTCTLSCEKFASSQDVTVALRKLAQETERPSIARVVLTGVCEARIVSELGAVYDVAAPEFSALELLDRTAPVEDFADLAREDTSLGLFMRRLNQQIEEASEPGRKQLLERARELGVAAFRRRELDVPGLERR